MNDLTWSAPEFHYHEKGRGWYTGVIVIAAAVILIALFQGNFLFAVFGALAGVLVAVWGTRSPRTITFTISKEGLDIGGRKFYSYGNLTGFAVGSTPEDQDRSELILRTKNYTSGWVRIMLEGGIEEEVRERIGKFVPEIEYEESLSDRIGRFLKF